MANIVVAYILWLTGGWLGLHHFYLGRDKHAFVWWATWGGCLGLGWFRDLWRLPEYVYEANNDKRYLNELKHRMEVFPRPPFNVTRFGGELVVGYLFGIVLRLVIPEEYTAHGIGWLLTVVLPPYGAAFGVHLVANIGRQKCTMSAPLIGASLGLPWSLYISENIMPGVLFAAILVNKFGIQWKEDRRDRENLCKRALVLTFCGMIYLSLWTSVIYLNCSVTNEHGETIPLREAIPNFFKSPAWENMKGTISKLYEYYKLYGWNKLWQQIVEAMDPTGEANAYKVLDLNETVSQKEITRRYRDLAKEWHPDKVKDPAKKMAAQERFIEIQKAYATLSEIKSRRTSKSMESDFPKKAKKQTHTEF
ncbi:dnaJ homolog subfamily C member 22-like [Mizuhopecten yessoensis]|uniref:DnaJ homolog subfamily C member 22 n=1 Tax=Mizuhopecten yessoensis TaxID=6573 RepID=A0A210Q9S6_MIZYE|nr:dnaJ homolog subfamily C member 22-like [Mizuhopecten yessoensis]OWF45497.1 DnaJ-like subfamily C member 22 [Mizuhopecten yessoensis]